MTKIIKHFKLITKHKIYVMKHCFIAGLYWQGIIHDLSKYYPTEFFESVKYFTGTETPINNARLNKGYSTSYLHHMGRNKHHFEYWIDDFMHGGIPIQMPFKYALELICDRVAAGKVYMKEDFSFKAEYDWWKSKMTDEMVIHPQTKLFIDSMMEELVKKNSLMVLRKQYAKKIYKKAEKIIKQENNIS